MGEMTPTDDFGDQPVQFLPFAVIDLSTIPTVPIAAPGGASNTPGKYAYLYSETLTPGIAVMCVNRDNVVECFGRRRRWFARYSVSGHFYDGNLGGTTYPYNFADIVLLAAQVDTPGLDERFLPHGHTRFLNISDDTSFPGVLEFSCSLNIGASPVLDTATFMLPGNGVVPMDLFDTSTVMGDVYYHVPTVYYSPDLNAWYISLFGGIGLHIINPTDPTDEGIDIPWQTGPPPSPVPDIHLPATATNSAGDFPAEAIATGVARIDPFPVMPGYFIRPIGWDVTMTITAFRAVAPLTNGFFEFCDADGDPCWHKDTGVQLKIPLPTGM